MFTRYRRTRRITSASSKVACYQLCKQMMTNHKLFSLLDDGGAAPTLRAPRCRRRRVGAKVLRRGRKNLHEFLFPRLPGTKDRSAIVLSQFKTRFHLHSSKSTRLEFRFCSENHSGLDMINSSQSVTSFKIWRRLMYERVYFVYFFMNKIGKK